VCTRELRSGIWCVLLHFEGTLLRALSSCMTFLDPTEGDTLAVVVVELHVGPSDSVMRSTNACNV
jgi:hypothetical protein